MRSAYLLFGILLASCNMATYQPLPNKLNVEGIDSVLVIGRTIDNSGEYTQMTEDSIKLVSSQIKVFCKSINGSKEVGYYKYMPKFFIYVYIKGEEPRVFRTTYNLVKEHGDLAYRLSDTSFLRRLYPDKDILSRSPKH